MLVKIKSKRASDAHDSRTQTKYTPSKRFGKSCSKFAFVQKWANDWRHYRKAMLQLTENSLLDTFFFVTSHSPSRWIFHLYNIRFGQLFVAAHFFNLKKFTRRKKTQTINWKYHKHIARSFLWPILFCIVFFLRIWLDYFFFRSIAHFIRVIDGKSKFTMALFTFLYTRMLYVHATCMSGALAIESSIA